MFKLLNYNHKIKTIMGNDYKFTFFLIILFLISSFLDLLGLSLIAPYMSLIIKGELDIQGNIFFGYKLINLDKSSLIHYIGFFIIAVFFLKSLFAICVQYIIIKICKVSQGKVAANLMFLYMHMPYNNYLYKKKGEFFHNIYGLSAAFAQILMTLLRLISEIIIAIAIFIYLTLVDFYILFSLFSVVFITVFIFDTAFKKRLKNWGKVMNDSGENISQTINESMINFKQLKVINGMLFFHERLKNQLKMLINSSVKAEITSISPRFALEFVTITFFILIIVVTATFKSNFSNLIPILTVFAIAIIRLLPFIYNFSSSLSRLRAAVNSIDRIYFTISNYEKYASQENNDIFFPENYKKINQISFDNVSFNYHQDNEYVLKNINIKIKAGEVIGISGKSGSGKTTFIDLLLGLLSPNIGSISYNDEILTEKSLKNFKKNFFYIPQDTFLLNDSIATNIILENEKRLFNKERLYYAMKKSRILDFVERLPKNIEESLGDHGNYLSGGQKQRINLARAVYFNSDILIFDEATNALDKNLELDIFNDFIKSFNEKTIIIVSHRKDVLDLCKYVYEIKDNQLIKK